MNIENLPPTKILHCTTIHISIKVAFANELIRLAGS